MINPFYREPENGKKKKRTNAPAQARVSALVKRYREEEKRKAAANNQRAHKQGDQTCGSK